MKTLKNRFGERFDVAFGGSLETFGTIFLFFGVRVLGYIFGGFWGSTRSSGGGQVGGDQVGLVALNHLPSTPKQLKEI